MTTWTSFLSTVAVMKMMDLNPYVIVLKMLNRLSSLILSTEDHWQFFTNVKFRKHNCTGKNCLSKLNLNAISINCRLLYTDAASDSFEPVLLKVAAEHTLIQSVVSAAKIVNRYRQALIYLIIFPSLSDMLDPRSWEPIVMSKHTSSFFCWTVFWSNPW